MLYKCYVKDVNIIYHLITKINIIIHHIFSGKEVKKRNRIPLKKST